MDRAEEVVYLVAQVLHAERHCEACFPRIGFIEPGDILSERFNEPMQLLHRLYGFAVQPALDTSLPRLPAFCGLFIRNVLIRLATDQSLAHPIRGAKSSNAQPAIQNARNRFPFPPVQFHRQIPATLALQFRAQPETPFSVSNHIASVFESPLKSSLGSNRS